MRTLKLILEYDGSAFYGFQKQPRHKTVQQVLEAALTKLFDQKTKISAASGRTDTGVHATHQVVSVKTESRLSIEKICQGLNYYLEGNVAVKEVSDVSEDFHARFNAKTKTYEYRIWNHSIRSPLRAGTHWFVSHPLDVEKIRKGMKRLSGRHDFSAFCSQNKRHEEASNIRKIIKFELIENDHELIFRVCGNGFLYRMVRNLVGTLVDLGRGKINLTELSKILASKKRARAGMAAPAHGLCLIDVTY